MIKAIITEEQYKNVIGEELNYDGIYQMIETGEEERIELVYTIGQSDPKFHEKVYKHYNDLIEFVLPHKPPYIDMDFKGKVQKTFEMINEKSYFSLLVSKAGVGFKQLPENIGLLRYVTDMDLSWNNLTSLPDSFAKLKQMKNLYLRGNFFESIPKELYQLQNLELLDLRDNQIPEEEVESLKQKMPNIKIRWS